MKEIWKTIENYDDYQVSSLGRIKSFKNDKEHILKPADNGNGYLFVILCKDGKLKNIKIHRLVANAFIPNPYKLPVINHKDKNRQNNNVNNLEFCTQQYNVDYSLAKKIGQYSKDGKLIKIWTSQHEAERYGFMQGHISDCCKGKRKTHKGFIWKYIDN